MWYRDCEPQMFGRIHKLVGTKDYINYRLTGQLATDYSYASGSGVYAAGDAVTGTTSVIEAIASGRNGAVVVDRYLGGSGDIDEALVPLDKPEPALGRREGFAHESRFENPRLAADERVISFCRIVHDLDEKEAVAESHRCLQCDLRLKITPVKYWGEY